MSIPSLSELCLIKAFQQGLTNSPDEKTLFYPQLRDVSERLVDQINPGLLLEQKIDPVNACFQIYQKASEAVRRSPSLANRSLAWISLSPSFTRLKNTLLKEWKEKSFQLDWISKISHTKDFIELFDLLLKLSPERVEVRNGFVLQAEDLCLAFLVRHDYWLGIGYVVQQGANPNIELPRKADDASKNLLHWSIGQNGFNLMTMALIHSRIDINLLDHNDKSPLELLAAKVPFLASPGYDLESALKFLIKKGADLSSYGQKTLEQVKRNQVPCHQGTHADKEKKRCQIIEMLEQEMGLRR
jgi:hypothetical protein